MDHEAMIQKAIYDLQARIGTFMQNGSKLLTINDRIKPYLSSKDAATAKTAAALKAQADGLLAAVSDIQARAMDTVSKATVIKTQVSATLQKVDGVPVNLSVLGSAFTSLIGESGRAALVLKDLASVGYDMEKTTAQVKTLEAGVGDLDQLSQGKGITARLEQALSLGSTNINKVVTILGVGLAAYLFLPGLLARGVKAVRRNPCGRRRRR